MHIAADMKHPDHMTRKDKLKMIAALPIEDATRFWLQYCPGISKAAFKKARGG